MDTGDAFELAVTPDRYLTIRYAGASGDFNPIPLDEEFARSVGLPGKILHGLWTMAQVARAHGELAGEPLALSSLTVPCDGRSIVDGEATVACEAVQDGHKLVRRGSAVLRI